MKPDPDPLLPPQTTGHQQEEVRADWSEEHVRAVNTQWAHLAYPPCVACEDAGLRPSRAIVCYVHGPVVNSELAADLQQCRERHEHLLKDMKLQTRWLGDLTHERNQLRASHEALIAALKLAAPEYCSNHCPSTFKSPEESRHTPKCKEIQMAFTDGGVTNNAQTSIPDPEKRAMESIPEFDEVPSLDGLIDSTVRAIMDVELAAFGDHCLAVNLRPIIKKAIVTAMDRCA